MNINLNCDLGEALGNDALIMPHLSACNIACGGHYGNSITVKQTIQLAQQHKVKIGAHPSYPDFKNFGRVSLNISEEELTQSLQSQLALFKKIVAQQNTKLNHIKAHGALYNDVAKDVQKANIYLKAVESFKESCKLFVPPNSAIFSLAKQQGFLICVEAFADRTYNDDLSLVNRKLPNALIQKPQQASEQVISIAENKIVKTANGREVLIKADTFCVHSDTTNAIEIIRHIRKYFSSKNIN